MRRSNMIPAALFAAAALAVLPGAGEAQFRYGGHLAFAGSYPPDDRPTFGLGARVGYGLPVLPVSVWGHGDYYLSGDVAGFETTYVTAGVDLHVESPVDLGLADPYLSGGWMLRNTSANDASATGYGFAAGLGVDLDLGLFPAVTVQVRREFFDDLDGGSQWVGRLGLTF